MIVIQLKEKTVNDYIVEDGGEENCGLTPIEDVVSWLLEEEMLAKCSTTRFSCTVVSPACLNHAS